MVDAQASALLGNRDSFNAATSELCQAQKSKTPAPSGQKRPWRKKSANEILCEKLADEIAHYKRNSHAAYQPLPAAKQFGGLHPKVYDMLFDLLATCRDLPTIKKKLPDISDFIVNYAARHGHFKRHGELGALNKSQRYFLCEDIKTDPDAGRICREWGLGLQAVEKYAKGLNVDLVYPADSKKGKEAARRRDMKDASYYVEAARKKKKAVSSASPKSAKNVDRTNQGLFDMARQNSSQSVITSKDKYNGCALPIEAPTNPVPQNRTKSAHEPH